MADNRYTFGNVQGPVQTGDGTQFNAGGHQYVAGGHQNIVGGDQVVHDSVPQDIIEAVTALHKVLKEMRLTAAERDRAERDLAAIEGAMRRKPDTRAVSRHLQSFATGLKEAGALASAGTSLAMLIEKIARWLGPLGAAVHAVL
jgi:hypothetical protein